MKKFWLISLLFLHGFAANAADQHDHTALKTAVSSFVQQQTAALPGKVTFHIDEIDTRLRLQPCNKVEVFLPSGSQLIGRVSVGVRCTEANSWSIFIPVQIKISRDLLISSRPLTLGQIIHAEDISRQTTELTQNSGITDSTQAIGKVLRYSIAAGYILREDMLRAPYSVKQGQVVQLSVQGHGFTMSSSGVALANASEGETVQIRTITGRVVSGIAIEEGVVKINP